MQRTLIAVFDNRGDARSAIEELVSSGFSRPQIRLSEGDPAGGASTLTGERAPETSSSSGSFADGIKNFLGTIFGTDNSEHVQKISDAVTRGHHVLSLTVGDEAEAARACAIVERFSPVDLDQGRGGAVKVFTHEAAATLNETEAAIEADDAYYLGHFNSTYAGAGDQYGNHAPAYKYGADMAASEQYRGRPWTDVSSELRRDWEGRNPGVAWDRFAASVRHGWERRGS